MTNAIEMFEKKQIEKLTAKKRVPAIRPGDTLKVTVKIIEGEKSRSQAFEGMCIARKNNSINSNFTVRKISHGEGVEKVFPLFSPIIEKIEVVRKGDVRRAKLYYLRDRAGKRARIADRDRGNEKDQYEFIVIDDASFDRTPYALELFHNESVKLSKIIKTLTSNPAKILKINKGNLNVGNDADFCILDINKPWVVKKENLISKSKNTSIDDRKLQGKITNTFVRGEELFKI